MEIKKFRKLIVVVIIFSVIIISVPAIIFFINFHSQPISDNIGDWGTFGDYFGGMLNSTISLLSLVILGFLTYFVSKQSSDESKKVNMLLRKLDVYKEYSEFIPNIRFAISVLGNKINSLSELMKEKKTFFDPVYINQRDSLLSEIYIFGKFYQYINHFELLHGHLFNYDFERADFIQLKEYASKLDDYYKHVIQYISVSETVSDDRKVDPSPDYLKFYICMETFAKSLKEELN